MAATARKAPLKVVPQGARRKALTVAAAAESGSRRDMLVALRNRIAADIDNTDTPPAVLAALSLRLLAIATEIEKLDAVKGIDDVGTAAGTPDEEWAAT